MNSAFDNHTDQPLAWSDRFLLGHDPMDTIHQEFVDIVGQMQGPPDPELPALLDRFAEHARSHFETENNWMEETEFPPRDCHIDEHAAVMRSVEEVRAVLALGNHDACRRLVDELARWFPSHADHLDSALAHWLCKRRMGGKPVVLRRGLSLR